MLSIEQAQQITTLAARGWSISAIARHLGHDRRTIRAHLQADPSNTAQPTKLDAFERFVPYVRARLNQDPRLPATALYNELVERGFTQSYPTLTAHLRTRGLRACDHKQSAPAGEPDAQQKHHLQRRNDTITVVVPAEPPQLTPSAARALLRILLKARRADSGPHQYDE